MNRAKLIEGDSLDWLRERDAASVDAVVTSPPYADQRSYRSGEREGLKNASRAQRRRAPSEAAAWLIPWLEEFARVLKPTGSAMVNVGVIMRDGEEVPWVDELTTHARAAGLGLLQRIVWHKPNAIPLSHAAYLHVKHEYVLWLAPSPREAYRGYDTDTRVAHSETSLRRIEQPYRTRKDERYAKQGATHALHPDGARPASVFTCGVGGQRTEHPAVMAPDLARWLVSLAAPRGGLVVDPFAGSATTGLACLERDRAFIGIELRAKYAAEARRRLALGRFPRLTAGPQTAAEQLALADEEWTSPGATENAALPHA